MINRRYLLLDRSYSSLTILNRERLIQKKRDYAFIYNHKASNVQQFIADLRMFFAFREDSFFTRNPEHALLKIEHSISALSSSDDPFAASHRMMNGWIVSANGSKIKQ